jgi:ABC-type multidrug transport system fused ATPase/permease subunit
MNFSFLNSSKSSLSLLNRNSRVKFWMGVALHASLSLLDLVGVLLTGVIGLLIVSNVQNKSYPEYVQNIITILKINGLSPTTLILLTSLTSLMFFVTKSLLSLFLSKKIFRFLGNQHYILSEKIVSNFMKSEYIWMSSLDPHRIANTISLGISAASINMLSQVLLLISESILLIFFAVLMLSLNISLALLTVSYLLLVLVILNFFIGKKVTIYNENMRDDLNFTKQRVFNSVLLFREIRVLGRQDSFVRDLMTPISRLSQNNAKDIWIQQVPKYSMEIALLIGMTTILGLATLTAQPEESLPILLVYSVAAARIFPILLRIQASLLSIRSYAPLARDAFELLKDLNLLTPDFPVSNLKDVQIKSSSNFAPDKLNEFIEVNDASFTYPTNSIPSLRQINLKIKSGDRVALVGASGAGKSTLCDLVLGLIRPSDGSVKIEGVPSDSWTKKNLGKVSYLPQETVIIPGTIEENICLGMDKELIDKSRLESVLCSAQLIDFVNSLPLGVQTRIGDGNSKLSGGQRQRIGIARVLYSDPVILIMDEATSALDAETESDVMKFLESLDKEITVILIAHRLSSIKNFPRIVYMEDGKILHEGSFEELRKKVEKFDLQAKLLGI